MKKILNKINFSHISFVTLFINIVCTIGIVFFSYNIYDVVKLGLERYDLIKEEQYKLSQLREEEVALKSDLEWYTSLDFIESQSRDYLNLALEGDSILVVPEDLFAEQEFLSSSNDLKTIDPDIRNWITLIF